MAAITDVTLVSGAPTAGDGTVSTLDKFNGIAGSSTTRALTVQGITSGTPVPVSGTFWQATQPVSAASLPLPTGAATSALQTTGNTSLATIATNSGSALAAGTAVIGKVGIDQASDGTTNAVRLLAETTKVIGTVNVAASQTIGVTNTPLTNFGAGEYETVIASQADQILGATGGVGDYLAGLLITPTTTSAGSVSIKDGNGSAIPIFNTGTLSNLVPFFVPLGMITVNATTPGWKVTTGASVTVIGIGNFT